MDKNSAERNPRLALLAYKLGYAPIKLELRARLHWETAELMEEPFPGPDPGVDYSVWPEEDSRFPVELASHLREIQDAGDALAEWLPRNSRDQLFKSLAEAPELAWRVYEAAWLGTRHRVKIRQREAAEEYVNMLDSSPFVETAWRDYRRAVRNFADSLPESLSTWAALGTHLAAAEGIMPPTFNLDPWPEQVSPVPFPVAADLFQKIKARDPLLEGLGPLGAESWVERIKQAGHLHDQILSRLDASGGAAVDDHERWVTASQALIYAQRMGVSRSLPWISKVATRSPAPFKSRSRGGRGRDVEKLSFIAYILEQGEQSDDESVVPGKAHPKSDTRVEAERREKQENEDREKRIEKARRAREKPPGDQGGPRQP